MFLGSSFIGVLRIRGKGGSSSGFRGVVTVLKDVLEEKERHFNRSALTPDVRSRQGARCRCAQGCGERQGP